MTLDPHRICKNTCIVKGKKKAHVIPRVSSPSSRTVSSYSTLTYSTSAIANRTMESRSFFTNQDTLSMISSPWSSDLSGTQASSQKSTRVNSTKPTSSQKNRKSLSSVLPKSSTTFGIPSPYITSKTLTTITLYNVASIATEPQSVAQIPINKHTDSMETLSSWTIESFTSNGTASTPCIVRPNYPWSPSTDVFSDRASTNFYPTSEYTLVSRKGSRASPWLIDSDINDMAPMNYVKPKLSEENFFLDWIHMKMKGVPIV